MKNQRPFNVNDNGRKSWPGFGGYRRRVYPGNSGEQQDECMGHKNYFMTQIFIRGSPGNKVGNSGK